MIDIIRSLYSDGLSANAISKRLGRPRRTIDRIISRLGIKRDIRSLISTYAVDTEYFAEINDQQRAYWLGFLLADGSLIKRNDRGVTIRILSLSISVKDVDHLELFKGHIRAEHPIGRYNHHGKHDYVRLSICCQSIARDLIRHGWDDFKIHGKWPPIPSDLCRHFLRGYVDGDGWISNHHGTPEIGLCCLYKEPLIRALDILNVNANLITDLHHNSTMTLWKWRKSGRICDGIYHTLYDDATVWLPRKREYLESLL